MVSLILTLLWLTQRDVTLLSGSILLFCVLSVRRCFHGEKIFEMIILSDQVNLRYSYHKWDSLLFFCHSLSSFRLFVVHQIVCHKLDRIAWTIFQRIYRYFATSVRACKITGTTVASRYWRVGIVLRSLTLLVHNLLLTSIVANQ